MTEENHGYYTIFFGETPVTIKRGTYIFLLSAVKGKRRKFGPGEFNFPFSSTASQRAMVSNVCMRRRCRLLLPADVSSSSVQPRGRTITVPAFVNVCKKKEEDRVYGERRCTHIGEMTGAIPFIQHPRWALYCPTISSPDSSCINKYEKKNVIFLFWIASLCNPVALRDPPPFCQLNMPFVSLVLLKEQIQTLENPSLLSVNTHRIVQKRRKRRKKENKLYPTPPTDHDLSKETHSRYCLFNILPFFFSFRRSSRCFFYVYCRCCFFLGRFFFFESGFDIVNNALIKSTNWTLLL